MFHNIVSKNARWLEAHLHRHYAASRQYGEWFALSAADLSHLAALDTCDSHPQLPHYYRVDRPTEFAPLIKYLREAAGLSLAALGEKAGLTRQQLSMIERGDRGPSIESLIALAVSLGVPACDLLECVPGFPAAARRKK